jgi:hypothetical protein
MTLRGDTDPTIIFFLRISAVRLAQKLARFQFFALPASRRVRSCGANHFWW